MCARVQLESEERLEGRTTILRRYIYRQFLYFPATHAANVRARIQTKLCAHTIVRMLARAARIKCSDSFRMLTSSSACSRGNQPASDAKTCCGSERAPRKCSTVPSRGYRRCPRGAGNSWRGEEEARSRETIASPRELQGARRKTALAPARQDREPPSFVLGLCPLICSCLFSQITAVCVSK